MGFKADKSITYTKNKFEEFLNEQGKEGLLANNIDISNIIFPQDLKKNQLGTYTRRKHKDWFDKYYLLWLDTK